MEKRGVGSIKGPKSTCRSSLALLGILSADLEQADAIDVSSPFSPIRTKKTSTSLQRWAAFTRSMG